MATKKDLVEAYSFSRRRLVTAFVSGAPGGREVEPARPGRSIIGGIALAVLLTAGAAVLGILKSPTDIDLTQEGLFSEKETGADYVVVANSEGEPEFRPVANITSAMLLFGSDVESQEVPRATIAEEGVQRGAPIGILEAPATPPESGSLIQSGWSACTGVLDTPEPTGIRLVVSEQANVTATPEASFVVATSEGRYLIAESQAGAERRPRAYAYRLPDGDEAVRVVRAVAGSQVQGVRVPDEWVTLFPPGGALEVATFGIGRDEFGQPAALARGLSGRARKAVVGDIIDTQQGPFVLTPDQALPLDDFSIAVYRALDLPRQFEPAFYGNVGQGPDGSEIATTRLTSALWPADVRTLGPTVQLCAVLDAQAGQQPGVALGTTISGGAASAEDVPFDTVSIDVDSGHGAFVSSGGWERSGPSSLALIDDRGLAYPVASGEERVNLGYSEVAEEVVPTPWVQLFDEGVPISIDSARCPPSTQDRTESCV